MRYREAIFLVVMAVSLAVAACSRHQSDAYEEFARIHVGSGGVVSPEAVRSKIADFFAVPTVKVPTPSVDELRRAVIDGLALDWLENPLTKPVVHVIGSRSSGGIRTDRLRMEMPGLGSMMAVLVVPIGHARIVPAVLVLHGHGDNEDDALEEYLGQDLANIGFVVLAPRFRVMGHDKVENQITLDLMSRGLTLMGIRVAEVLMAAAWLAEQPDVDGGRIGVLGHSGGAVVATLATRVEPGRFTAIVTDFSSDFRGMMDGTLPHTWAHCETIPALAPLADAIDDEKTLNIASLKVPYEFDDLVDRDRIRQFFKSNLN